MATNNLFFASQNRFAKLRAFCYSLLLWGVVVFLCFSALILLQLSLSTRAQGRLTNFLAHYPLLVGLSAVLPLMAAGALMTYLLRYRHACYTFHSSLLAYDVDVSVIASTIETGWNRQHPELPITCHVTSKGRTLKVSITAPPPPQQFERERAEQLHTWTMDQLQTLLVAKHPITFHIQWSERPSLLNLFDASTTPHA